MERISTRSLTDRPVESASRPVGTVRRVWFNLDTGTVIGFVVQPTRGKNPRILLRSRLRSWNDSLLIGNPDDLDLPVSRSRAAKVARAAQHVLDAEAVTEDGRSFGRVTDLILSLPEWSLVQVIVSETGGERVLDRNLISRLQDDRVIFINEVLDGTRPWATTGLPTQAPA